VADEPEPDPQQVDPRAAALEVAVAQERTRAAMFGRSQARHTIGRYLLMAPIGRGGMGMVFAAYDAQLDRRIAIKLVRPRGSDAAAAEALRARIVAEARAMAKLSHPNVVTVHEAGTADDDPTLVYLAMELVDGVTLRRWLADAPRPWREIVAVHVAAGRGLAAVHRAGLVHRDFKGDNAMIDRDGRVRVMDFGLARELDDDALDTGDGTASPGTRPSGTPGYMAPEQLRGDAVDHRVDQYALCVSLYESLWGRRPYRDDGTLEPPRATVPARVRQAIVRGLAVDREMRFASMDALLAALEPRARGRSLAFVLGAAATVAIPLALASTRPTPCAADRLRDDALADPALRTAIERAFTATAVPAADQTAAQTIAALDRYAERWHAERVRACEATRVSGLQSEARMDRRMRCLERRRRTALALASELAEADATAVDHAVGVFDRMIDPSRCDDDDVLDAAGDPPGDAELAARVDALDAELARVDALAELGHSEQAARLADAQLEPARALAFEPVLARAELAAAQAHWQSGEVEFSRPRLRDAYFAARRTHQGEAAAWAAFELASLRATGDGAIDDARLWLALGDAELHADHLIELETERLGVAAIVAHAAGAWDEAIALSEQRITRLAAGCDGECDQLGDAHEELADTLIDLGRYDEALVHARAALAYEQRIHDAGHPHVALSRKQAGMALTRTGHASEGIDEVTRALADLEARWGADHLQVVSTRGTLGIVLSEHGRVPEAIATLERAVAGAAQGSPLWVSLQHALGGAYYEADRMDEAAAAYRSSLAAIELQFPDGHLNTAMVIADVANVEARRGRHAEALVGFQRALALRKRLAGGDDPLRARLLANVAVELKRLDRPREALPYLEEAVELTRTGTIDATGVQVRRGLASLRDPAGARAVRDELAARCDALTDEQRAVARCEPT
jgi:eukaryotic-like serine/threonine-protein kinase